MISGGRTCKKPRGNLTETYLHMCACVCGWVGVCVIVLDYYFKLHVTAVRVLC